MTTPNVDRQGFHEEKVSEYYGTGARENNIICIVLI